MGGGGLGMSIREASSLTLMQVDNLMRPPTKSGLPANKEVERIRNLNEAIIAKAGNANVMESLRLMGEI